MTVAASELAAVWRTRATELRDHAAEGAARAYEKAAGELEAALAAAGADELTLAEAVFASGYSDRQLRAMLADGRLVNRGRKHAPRIRRADLPKKATAAPQAGASGPYDPVADARHLAGRLRAS